MTRIGFEYQKTHTKLSKLRLLISNILLQRLQLKLMMAEMFLHCHLNKMATHLGASRFHLLQSRHEHFEVQSLLAVECDASCEYATLHPVKSIEMHLRVCLKATDLT